MKPHASMVALCTASKVDSYICLCPLGFQADIICEDGEKDAN